MGATWKTFRFKMWGLEIIYPSLRCFLFFHNYLLLFMYLFFLLCGKTVKNWIFQKFNIIDCIILFESSVYLWIWKNALHGSFTLITPNAPYLRLFFSLSYIFIGSQTFTTSKIAFRAWVRNRWIRDNPLPSDLIKLLKSYYEALSVTSWFNFLKVERSYFWRKFGVNHLKLK